MTQIDTSAHGRGAAQLRNHMRRAAFKQPRLTLDVQVLIDSTWHKCEAVGGWGDKSGAAVRQEAARASAGVASTKKKKKAQLKNVSENVLAV